VFKNRLSCTTEKDCYKISAKKVYTDEDLKIIGKCGGFYWKIVVNESLEKISAQCSCARKKI
jgi:hypothetical protein